MIANVVFYSIAEMLTCIILYLILVLYFTVLIIQGQQFNLFRHFFKKKAKFWWIFDFMKQQGAEDYP